MENQDTTSISTSCRLQTFVTPSENEQLDIHPVFDQGQIPVGFEKFSSLPVDFVHFAWALLLRSYVFSDAVSFGLFITSQEELSHDIPHDHATASKLNVRVEKVLLCRYHAISERKWGDWVPDAHQDLSKIETSDIQINTAVRQWTQGILENRKLPCLHSDGFSQYVSARISYQDANLYRCDVARRDVYFEPSVSKLWSIFASSSPRSCLPFCLYQWQFLIRQIFPPSLLAVPHSTLECLGSLLQTE